MFKLTPKVMKDVNVHLVEASPLLKKVQEARLCGSYHDKASETNAVTKFGPPVTWHSRLGEVPKGFTFFLANEFFDALPIHKFVRDKDSNQWNEVLVGIDEKV